MFFITIAGFSIGNLLILRTKILGGLRQGRIKITMAISPYKVCNLARAQMPISDVSTMEKESRTVIISLFMHFLSISPHGARTHSLQGIYTLDVPVVDSL